MQLESTTQHTVVGGHGQVMLWGAVFCPSGTLGPCTGLHTHAVCCLGHFSGESDVLWSGQGCPCLLLRHRNTEQPWRNLLALFWTIIIREITHNHPQSLLLLLWKTSARQHDLSSELKVSLTLLEQRKQSSSPRAHSLHLYLLYNISHLSECRAVPQKCLVCFCPWALAEAVSSCLERLYHPRLSVL